jgi:hypothetical protein
MRKKKKKKKKKKRRRRRKREKNKKKLRLDIYADGEEAGGGEEGHGADRRLVSAHRTVRCVSGGSTTGIEEIGDRARRFQPVDYPQLSSGSALGSRLPGRLGQWGEETGSGNQRSSGVGLERRLSRRRSSRRNIHGRSSRACASLPRNSRATPAQLPRNSRAHAASTQMAAPGLPRAPQVGCAYVPCLSAPSFSICASGAFAPRRALTSPPTHPTTTNAHPPTFQLCCKTITV